MREGCISTERSERGSGLIKTKLLYPALLAALVLIVFSNTFSNDFAFDDNSTIKRNAALRDSKHVALYFTTPFFLLGRPASGPVAYDYYRPMVFISYFADYSLFGLAPKGWHATNILLHAIAVALVFALFGKLGLSPGASFIGAALFAAHPAIADSVASVAGRSDPLCAIFYLACIWLYIDARNRRFTLALPLLACSWIAFALALLSKENAVAVPALLAAYEILRPGDGQKRKPWRLPPYFAILGAYALLRSRIVPTSGVISDGFADLALRLMTAAEISISYALTALFPHGLGFETYSPLVNSAGDLRGLASIAAVLVIAIGAVSLCRKSPRISFLAAWFLICLAPYAYLFLFHPGPKLFTPPHFLYFPLIGLAGLAGAGSIRLAERIGAGGRRLQAGVVLIVVGIIVLLFGVQTRRRNVVWRDDYTFFSAMSKYAPDSARIRIGMGSAFMRKGHFGAALSEYAAAWELARSDKPESVEDIIVPSETSGGRLMGRMTISNYNAAGALAGMGDAYRAMGENASAISSYEEALSENAFDVSIHFRLARAREEVGRFDEAIDSYERALRIDPGLSAAASALLVAREKKKVFERAESVYQKALRNGRTDSAAALYSEALIARFSGELALAEALLREALEKDGAHFGANMALGEILRGRGERHAALGFFSLAYAARPTSALAAYQVAVTNLAVGDTLGAERWAEKAYALAPASHYKNFLIRIRTARVLEEAAE